MQAQYKTPDIQDSPSTERLLTTREFAHRYDDASRFQHLELSYRRARAIAKHHNLSMHDVLHLTPKFWNSHCDKIIVRDITAHILFSIQINLAAGTIARYAVDRPDLRQFLEDVLQFDVLASFMLTELGHGCDARNIETTATLQPNGGFILHSPTPESRKFMPPSMPIAGIPRVATVFARLLVYGEDRGIRPFIVSLNDGYRMSEGVKTQLLPPMSSNKSLDHSLTSFDTVSLPPSALLGDLRKPKNPRIQFLDSISRVETGTVSLSLWTIPFLQCAAHIVGKYSLRRTVQAGAQGERVPVWSFRTQQIPVLTTIAHVKVMEALADWVIPLYKDPALHPGTRHALATIAKAVFVQHAQTDLASLIERSGAQGLYVHNQMVEMEAITRATGIAEGELLVLCIRHATELLLGRYTVPPATNPNGLLAKHESGIISHLQSLSSTISTHRSPEHNASILPQTKPMILAIGHRMAYEAGLRAGIDADLLALYEAHAIRSNDSAWYAEHEGLGGAAQFEMEKSALNSVMPRMEKYVDSFGIESYVTAPMAGGEKWHGLEANAEVFEERGKSLLDVGKVDLGLFAGLVGGAEGAVRVQARL